MKFIFYIALAFLITYLTLDVLIVNEGVTSRLIVQVVAGLGLGIMLLYNSLYFKSKAALSKHWKFVRPWFVFIVIIVLYYIGAFIGFPSDLADTNGRNLIIPIFIFTTIFFIYNGTVKGHLKGTALTLLILFLMFNGLSEIYLAYTNKFIRQGMELIDTSAGYVFVMILPLLMYKYKKENVWVFLITFILTMMTGKRGALVIYAVLILYSMYSFKTIKQQVKINWKTILFLVLIFVAYNFFIKNGFESLQYRILNIQNEQRGSIGSGRNIIWLTLLSAWIDGPLLNQLFGFGFYATRAISGGFIAHNDFFEFLIDFGVLGLSFWLFVLYRFYKNIRLIKKLDNYLYLLLLFCWFILVGRGATAGTLRTDSINLSISLGYLLAVSHLKIKSYNEQSG